MHEFQPFVATDLAGRWESYRVFIAPVNWRFRSGDRFEFNVNPTGERLVAPFEVADGVVIAPGSLPLAALPARGRHGAEAAALHAGDVVVRRLLRRQLDQVDLDRRLEPDALLTVEFTGERNIGRLPAGDFTQTLVGNRLRVNLSPDLSVASYVQYDTDSDSVGVNTRLRWTFKPVADLFVVYNHNVRSLLDRWQLESNQLLIKLQYAFRR